MKGIALTTYQALLISGNSNIKQFCNANNITFKMKIRPTYEVVIFSDGSFLYV